MVIDLESFCGVDDERGRKWVRDEVFNTKVISHFCATKEGALSVLQFDPSGTLLATASDRGSVINVYKIEPNQQDIFNSHQHLYILKRGVTPTIIKDINFSADSKLIAITSFPKGTTHIYGINPQGGVVDAISHLDVNNQERSVMHQYATNEYSSSNRTQVLEPLPSQKLAVVHSNYSIPVSLDQTSMDTEKLFASAIYIDPFTMNKDYIMFNLESNGLLNLYRMKLGKSDTNPFLLCGTMNGIVEWDIRRITKSRAYSFKLSHHPKVPNPEPDPNMKNNHSVWLSNIEIETCTLSHTPFWLAHDLFPLEAYVELPQVEDPSMLLDPVYQDDIYRHSRHVAISTIDLNQKQFLSRDVQLSSILIPQVQEAPIILINPQPPQEPNQQNDLVQTNSPNLNSL
eukprot:TRINITY_DN15448_c0_g1_i1.p1 TRINITY_DN15448_c0_g1~~TRINITY_DN15448_c0_g1_i1.p1  ORF type:complete len:400 (-),score=95.07 TRINITY_DN15448_c0_g1_i1:45-1244(-)